MAKYRKFIAAQSERNPSIQNVIKFVEEESLDGPNCNLTSLEFSSNNTCPQINPIKPDQLERELQSYNNNMGSKRICGRILIIEDLTPDVVETLGSLLHLDPLFFASHLQSPWPDISTQTPEMAMLPSRHRPNVFVNIHYHRTIVLEDAELSVRQLLRPSNVYRKIVVLPKMKGIRIGLAQHCCSLYKAILQDNSWICVVLVDPPMGSTYYSIKERRKDILHFNIRTRHFLGGYEDFLDPESPWDPSSISGPSRSGLMKDLVYYWTRHQPEFFGKTPTLLDLAYFPLRIIAGEWVNYLTVMHHSIKQYEYRIGDLPDLLRELTRLNSDLQSLQSWRRRSMSSEQKLKSTARFIRRSEGSAASQSPWDLLAQDYDHLATSVDDFGQRFERMLPIVTSMVQIADSRQSFAETTNVSRLTYLALVFVPLTFTTGLFSMNSDTAPGTSGFWLFFVVAIPMTAIVFMAARPPVEETRALLNYMNRLGIQNLPQFRERIATGPSHGPTSPGEEQAVSSSVLSQSPARLNRD